MISERAAARHRALPFLVRLGIPLLAKGRKILGQEGFFLGATGFPPEKYSSGLGICHLRDQHEAARAGHLTNPQGSFAKEEKEGPSRQRAAGLPTRTDSSWKPPNDRVKTGFKNVSKRSELQSSANNASRKLARRKY